MKTKLFTIAIISATIGCHTNTENPISVTVTSVEKKSEFQEILPNTKINNFNPGESIFKAKCASCHSVMKDGYAPKLKGAIKKWEDEGEGELIYEWVRNNIALRSNGKSKRAIQIFDEWNGLAHTLFPDLTNEQIDWIFDYVENGYVEDTTTYFEYEPITIDPECLEKEKSFNNYFYLENTTYLLHQLPVISETTKEPITGIIYDCDNGNIVLEMNYINGIRDGISRTYYENGQLQTETYYTNNVKNSTYKDWWENGNERTYQKGNCGYDLDSKEKSGLFKKWYESGQIELLKKYEDGILIEEKYFNEKGDLIDNPYK